jgi:signal peptidase I
MRSFLSSVLEIFEIAAIAIAAVFLIRSTVVQPFLVSGSSMSPNFSDGDYLLVDQLTYHFREPQRGEVAVFHFHSTPNDNSTYFIKRIVGLPGEEVKVQNDKVTIKNSEHPDGFVLDETYLPPGTDTSGSVDAVLGPNEYFVLGDNRSYSFDSRSWGKLERKDIVGLVRLRLWPPNDATVFAAPQFNQ